ncbi:MAG: DUF1800 family protein [Bacteroidota bacterium]|nr:DUF1800 family protein [Bacteroidota bacterium]
MASLNPFEGALGSRLAKHLLRRATFNISQQRIGQFAAYNVDQAISQLLAPSVKNLNQPIHYVNGELTQPTPWINDDPDYGAVNENNSSGAQRLNNFLDGWWMDEARRDTSLRSKMTYFLFTNLTAPQKDNGKSSYYYDYLMLLEHFCLSDWKELIFQVSVNPRMLEFLNNDLNTKGLVNENYARELLELYTIGVGKPLYIDDNGNIAFDGDPLNYSETIDIPEVARILTGWRFDKNNRPGMPLNGIENGNLPTGYALPDEHDFDAKQLSEYFDNYQIDAWDPTGRSESDKKAQMESELRGLIDKILEQDETSKYICRKLYRFFVSRNISEEIEDDIIVPLAASFRTNYNLTEVITQLLKSKHFYDADDTDTSDEIIGGLIKSPLELLLQSITLLNFPVPDPITKGELHYRVFYENTIIKKFLDISAQPIFGDVNTPPAGFPAHYSSPNFDKSWFNSSTIIPRYNICKIVFFKGNFGFNPGDYIKEVVPNPSDPEEIVNVLTNMLFPETPSQERKQYFIDTFLFDGGSLLQQGDEKYYYWNSLWSDYLGGKKENTVHSILESLIEALIWSQEYQTT